MPLAVTVSLSNGVVVAVSAVSMCSQKRQRGGAACRDGHGLGQRVGVRGAVAVQPGIPAAGVGGLPGCSLLMTPAVAVHGAAVPVSKPGLPSSWAGAAAAAGGADRPGEGGRAGAPVVSVAVTVTLEVPAVVGVPEIRPRGADRQAGGQPGGGVGQGLAGGRVAGVDLQADRGADGAGLVAGAGDGDGVAAAALLIVQVKVALAVAPVVSVAVTVTLEVAAVVGRAGDQAGES